MELNKTTPVPNWVLDSHMSKLSGAELKLLLTIIRSTLGWMDHKTKKRKSRDWISHSQFVARTGLSERAVTLGVKTLIEKNIINVTNQIGESLKSPDARRFAHRIFYQLQKEQNGKPSAITSNNLTHYQKQLPHKLPSTKEIQKKFSRPVNKKLSDRERYEEILLNQQQEQIKRDGWL